MAIIRLIVTLKIYYVRVTINLMMAMNWPKHVVAYYLQYTFFIELLCY